VSTTRRRIRIELAYDGTEYAGWQVQSDRRTIQGTLQEVLSRMHGGTPMSVRGAGRTDAGAHARGQVADCEVDTRLDDERLFHALRCLLPADLRAVALRTVSSAFNSRRDAASKTYRYRLDLSAHGDPFLARYALHHAGPFDPDAVSRALALLPGERDWSSFTAGACEIEDRVRRLTEARFTRPTPEEGWFSFTANGFLTHMVRNLVGTLLEVARGKRAPEREEEILEGKDRRLAGPGAPARGLVLWEVRY
jgi:tRNA pseudouridine38-40 synthase